MFSSLPSSTEKSMLLSLPPYIRHQIYHHINIPVDTVLRPQNEYILYNAGWPAYNSKKNHPSTKSAFRLLLVCRVINSEVSHLLYSQNTIIIDDSRALLNFRPTTIASFTSLKMGLSYISQQYNDHCCHLYGSNEIENFDSTVADWKAAVDYIAPHIQPSKLVLELICDTDLERNKLEKVKAAKGMVAPISQLPTLLGCHIRLGANPNKALFDIAKSAATRAVNQLRRPFRYFDLPFEIRAHILSFTDLVTPPNEVEFEYGQGYRVSTKNKRKTRIRNPTNHPTDHRICWSFTDIEKFTSFWDAEDFLEEKAKTPCRFSGMNQSTENLRGHCWWRDEYYSQFYSCPGADENCKRSMREPGCFCRALHTAYSPLCRCWAPPSELFGISKAFKADAEAVFFSQNHIIVREYSEEVPIKVAKGTSIVQFLDSLSPVAIRNLRSLEICLDNESLRDDANPEAYEGWRSAIERHKNKLNLRFLWIQEDHKGPRWGFDKTKNFVHRNIWSLEDVGITAPTRTLAYTSSDDNGTTRYYLRHPSEISVIRMMDGYGSLHLMTTCQFRPVTDAPPKFDDDGESGGEVGNKGKKVEKYRGPLIEGFFHCSATRTQPIF